ncbi:MFS transporter, partial [Vibrio fluvialis]
MLMVLMPIMGKWADGLGSRKVLPLIGMLSAFVCIYPAFTLLGGEASLVKALFIIGALIALFALSNASLLVLIMEAFAQQYRASGISMIYGFGVTVFGGFTPLLVASLIEWSGNKMAPAFYLMVAVAVSSLAIWRFPTRAPQQH